MWVGIIQSIQGLHRSKRWRKGKGQLFAWAVTTTFICPQISVLPGSWAFKLGLGLTPLAFLALKPSDLGWIYNTSFTGLPAYRWPPWDLLVSIMAWANSYNKSLRRPSIHPSIHPSIQPICSVSLESPNTLGSRVSASVCSAPGNPKHHCQALSVSITPPRHPETINGSLLCFSLGLSLDQFVFLFRIHFGAVKGTYTGGWGLVRDLGSSSHLRRWACSKAMLHKPLWCLI